MTAPSLPLPTALARSRCASSPAPTPDLETALAPLRERLLAHPIYDAIGDEQAVVRFMEHHVFAVWDFMSLVKSLARRLSCVDVPWVPTASAAERRFVNEIVLDEESDIDADGRPSSHFEMYVDAMRRAGADPRPVEDMIAGLRRGESPDQAAQRAGVPPAARRFLETTMSLAGGSDAEVAAAFAYGRELVIPPMFRAVVARLGDRDADRWSRFAFYLDRHIETDGETHGPMARAIVERIVAGDPDRTRAALGAAERALEARLALWDATCEAIRSSRDDGR
jgi:hypothetical protein